MSKKSYSPFSGDDDAKLSRQPEANLESAEDGWLDEEPWEDEEPDIPEARALLAGAILRSRGEE